MFRRNKRTVISTVKLILTRNDHCFGGPNGDEVDVEGYDVELPDGRRLPRDDGEYVLPGVCHFKIAGVTHHGVAARSLTPLKPVELLPDPNNEYDANAIEIRVDGHLVGYVPKALAAAIRTDLPDRVSGIVTRNYSKKGERIGAEVLVGITEEVSVEVHNEPDDDPDTDEDED